MKLLKLYHPLLIIVLLTACRRLNISNYYHRHKQSLDSMETTFRAAYQKKPFSIEFTDRSFNRVSLELVTDTLTYIYEYQVGEPRMLDTLKKFGYDTTAINYLNRTMQSRACTWIDNLDYYGDTTKHSLI